MQTFGQKFDERLLLSTGADAISGIEMVQELWSGYGRIVRVALAGASIESVVVKHVRMPNETNHPRGWNTDISHQRKVKSYTVETCWYQNWSDRCNDTCRVPECLAFEQQGDEIFLVLEDLDDAGFPVRLSQVQWYSVEACLGWLADFHAVFLQANPGGLWDTGTYWHLDTRPDELEKLDDEPLKKAAHKIDATLRAANYQTFVHGDAKLANFCFSKDKKRVAAVDFQYIGGGCGMKDVAYFVGSCLDEATCEKDESKLLSTYFDHLRTALKQHQPNVEPEDVIDEWRELYHVAWTDFHRFIKGWCPGHWKINDYSERLAREVIKSSSH